MDVMGLGSVYDAQKEYAVRNAEADKLTNKLKNSSEATDGELMEVCKDFEAYFMEQVYKEMWKTVPKEESDNAVLVDYFKEQAISTLALKSVENNNGTGLAQTLYEQMRRNNEI